MTRARVVRHARRPRTGTNVVLLHVVVHRERRRARRTRGGGGEAGDPAASRCAEAKTILGRMTRGVGGGRETKRRVKKTERKGGKGVNGVSAAGETTTASYERRHAAAGTGTRDGRGTKREDAGGGFGPNPYATLEKRNPPRFCLKMRSWRWRRRCPRERERAVRDMRAKGMARRDAARRGASRSDAPRRSCEEPRRSKARRGGCATTGGDGKETRQEGGEEVERFRRARASQGQGQGKPEETPKRGGGVAGVVVEIGKFALPAVIAWFARQPTINELRLNLEAMTAAKARADEEASKIRAKLVELEKQAGSPKRRSPIRRPRLRRS